MRLKILSECCVLAFVTPLLKKIFPLQKIICWYTPDKKQHVVNPMWIDYYLHKILSVCFFGRVNCLTRSLILFRQLNRYTASVELVIGVNKKGDVLEGHSWIEKDSQPLFEKNQVDTEFFEMIRYPLKTGNNDGDSR